MFRRIEAAYVWRVRRSVLGSVGPIHRLREPRAILRPERGVVRRGLVRLAQVLAEVSGGEGLAEVGSVEDVLEAFPASGIRTLVLMQRHQNAW